MALTRLKPNSPTSPQLIAPIVARISAIQSTVVRRTMVLLLGVHRRGQRHQLKTPWSTAPARGGPSVTSSPSPFRRTSASWHASDPSYVLARPSGASGRRNENVDPLPGLLSNQIRPLCASMSCLLRYSPRPVSPRY